MNQASPDLPSITPGMIYEDCAYHPVLCVESDPEEDFVRGVSLIDGTQPRECSLRHCGVRPMSVSEAWQVKLHGPGDPEAREAIDPDRRWWIEP